MHNSVRLKTAMTCAAMACLLAAAATVSAQKPQGSVDFKQLPQRESDTQREKLLKQRYNTAIEEYELAHGLYRNGHASLDLITNAARHIGEAKIALTTSSQEKITALKELLELFQNFEVLVSQRVKGGAATQLDNVQARYLRLDIELQLLAAEEAAKQAGLINSAGAVGSHRWPGQRLARRGWRSR